MFWDPQNTLASPWPSSIPVTHSISESHLIFDLYSIPGLQPISQSCSFLITINSLAPGVKYHHLSWAQEDFSDPQLLQPMTLRPVGPREPRISPEVSTDWESSNAWEALVYLLIWDPSPQSQSLYYLRPIPRSLLKSEQRCREPGSAVALLLEGNAASNLNLLVTVIILECWAPPSGSNREKRQTFDAVLNNPSTPSFLPLSCLCLCAHLTVLEMIHSSHDDWAFCPVKPSLSLQT